MKARSNAAEIPPEPNSRKPWRSLPKPPVASSGLGQVLKTSVPIIVDLASQILMWTIEATLVGRIPRRMLAEFGAEATGSDALTAVGNVVQIIIFTFTIFLTFIIGATLSVNRFIGAGKRRAANHFFSQAVFAAAILSFFVAAGWFLLADEIFHYVLGATPAVTRIGTHYFRIAALYLPFILVNFVMLGVIRGSGQTKISMGVNLLINTLHLTLAIGLIFGYLGFPGLGVTGAAIAGGTAHTIGCLVTMGLVVRGRSLLRFERQDIFKVRLRSLRDIFSQGFPTTLEQLFWTGGMTVVLTLANRLGAAAATLHIILITLQRLLSMVYQAFGLGAMTLVGQHFGARRPDDVERTVKFFTIVATSLVFALNLIFFVFARSIVLLFTSDPALAETGSTLIKVLALVQLPKSLTIVLGAALRGVGDVHYPMFLTIVGVILFEIGLGATFAFTAGLGILGFWIATGIDETFRTGLNFARLRRGRWR